MWSLWVLKADGQTGVRNYWIPEYSYHGNAILIQTHFKAVHIYTDEARQLLGRDTSS